MAVRSLFVGLCRFAHLLGCHFGDELLDGLLSHLTLDSIGSLYLVGCSLGDRFATGHGSQTCDSMLDLTYRLS